MLRGVEPGVADDDLIVLWGADASSWFDPIVAVEAFAAALDAAPNAKLVVPGLSGADEWPAVAERVRRRAQQLGIESSVLVREDVPDELRESYLLEADVAVVATRDVARSRLAFRSDLLDCLWAGLPVITTGGDVLSDAIRESGAGLVVPPANVDAFAAALVDVLSDSARRAALGAKAAQMATTMTWHNAVEPVRRVARAPWRWQTVRATRARGRVVSANVQHMLDERDAELTQLRSQLEELDLLRHHVEELKGIVAHKDRPYAVARSVARWFRPKP